ncbi:NIPSNAP family protein [Edaphobacter paludis]|uniref:NIPSNAP family protein n=1 Tax=Edaphobacter paludis TaxID=3035702 RepID=A0AAU7D8U8_9BACT
MKRRDFLTSSLAASTLALASQPQSGVAQSPAAAGPREYYQIRKYHMQSGPQTKLTDSYVADSLIPALNRLGIAPVGAFHLDLGPETPTLYLLLPCSNLETLVNVDLRLAQDEQFMKTAQPFWSAPATAPAFIRMESSLLAAFEGHPKLTPPPSAAQHGKRVFQLRTYESPSDADHVRKVEMFHHGEFEIFQKAGFDQVFYGDTLIGPRMPNLTYMLSYPELSDLTDKWKRFSSDPDWKKLSSSSRYSFEPIVSNVTNLILSPTAYSQI